MAVNKGLIVSLDIGTTNVKSYVFDKHGNVRGSARAEVTLISPSPERVEIDPEDLWNKVTDTVINAVTAVGPKEVDNLMGLGISCQRNTFITWNKKTGRPYHNFITWKDLRASSITNELNTSLKMKLLRLASKCLYKVTFNDRYVAGSILQITNNQVTPRLVWVLRNIPEIAKDLQTSPNDVAFGTIDTYLIYRLTGGQMFVTDISNASSTALFDPFTLSWAGWAFSMFSIPLSIFPEVVDCAGDHFGQISFPILGVHLPILSCIADQSASMFGSCCFERGDTKATLGTGTFLDINTGSSPHASYLGTYPLVAWRYKGKTLYLAEGLVNDTASIIQMAITLGLISTPEECSDVAYSVPSSHGIYFSSALNGYQAPINDDKAAAGFIGLKVSSTKPHLLHAMLKSVVFRLVQLINIMKTEVKYFSPPFIHVDGGVSRCNFIAQSLADISGLPVKRSAFQDKSALGAAYLAGLTAGLWVDEDELLNISSETEEFHPDKNVGLQLEEEYVEWNNAIKRFLNWY